MYLADLGEVLYFSKCYAVTSGRLATNCGGQGLIVHIAHQNVYTTILLLSSNNGNPYILSYILANNVVIIICSSYRRILSELK